MLVDPQDRCLRNVNSGQAIIGSFRWIPEVLMMEEKAVKDGEILLILDASELYSSYIQSLSAEQVARHCEHKF